MSEPQKNLIALLLLGAAILVYGTEPKHGSPDEALDRFYKLINDGALLTNDGWRQAAKMFERQAARPDDEMIFVVTKFPLGNGPMDVNGDRAVAYQKWVDDIGTIDSKFRYHAPKADPEIEGVIRVFKLVRTETYWGLRADGRLEEVHGPPEWRIQGSLTARTTSRAAAIRYLTQKRDEATDPTLKANAQKTIAILKGLPKRRTHI